MKTGFKMRKGKIRTLVLLALAVCVLSCQAAFSAPAKASAAKLGVAAKRLNLSADQKTKIKVIRDNARKEAESVRADASLSPDGKKVRIQAIRKAARNDIWQLLTPRQQAGVLRHCKPARQEAARRLAKYLDLTPVQRTQIRDIIQKRVADIRAVRANASLTGEAKAAQIARIRAASKASILQVLTLDQRAKLDAARAKWLKK